MTMKVVDNNIGMLQRNTDIEMSEVTKEAKPNIDDGLADHSDHTEPRLNSKCCSNNNIENASQNENLKESNLHCVGDDRIDRDSTECNPQDISHIHSTLSDSQYPEEEINSTALNSVNSIRSRHHNSVEPTTHSIHSHLQNYGDETYAIHPNSQTFVNPSNSISSECSLPSYKRNLRFGWKCISPNSLQLLNRPIFFLICLCFSGIAQGLVVTGISFTVLTSIEKQFGLKSTEVALFGTAYDIAYGICSVFVGYVGHVHKPRCIGLGIVLMAIGAVTLALPKFVFGTYEAGVERSSDYCDIGNIGVLTTAIGNITNVTDDCAPPKEWYYQFIFVIGNVLLGIGAIPLYTLAPAHIDDVTKRGQSSIYMGIYFGCCAIGPALGFFIGMPVLNAWVELKQPANSSLLPSDTNWVGAWWLGYLIGAVLLLLPLVPMLGFPQTFSNTEAIRTNKLQLDDTIEEDTYLKHDLKSVWPATKSLLKNPPFLLISLSHSCECLAVGGFSTFLTKFVQTQFHFTASKSALFTGVIVISGAAGGLFLGGYILNRFSWNCKKILRFATIMALLATLCTAIALVGCEGREVVGQQENRTYVFTNDCNRDCQCVTDVYKPICTEKDQKTYYSPCHAGCSKSNLINKEFHNCTCFSENIKHAVNGRCTNECTLFPLSLVGSIFLMLFTFMNNVPMLTATFRVVNEGQGSFAMGFQQIFIRFLGFIPAPILFGSLIDKSCNLWQYDPCTLETTSCLEYDQARFRYYMFTLGVVTKFSSFVFIFLAYKLYRLPESRTSPSPADDLSKPAAKIFEEVIKNENASMDQ